jgi:multiple sugar transport system permease protein
MTELAIARPPPRLPTTWDRLKTNRGWLGFWFMVPAAAFLILFWA